MGAPVVVVRPRTMDRLGRLRARPFSTPGLSRSRGSSLLMKVLHVIPTIADRTGGPAAAVLESSRVLSERGFRCTVLTTDLGEAASAARHTRITPEAGITTPEVELRM